MMARQESTIFLACAVKSGACLRNHNVALSGEIEVRMIGQVHHGVFVGRGGILDSQIALDQRVANCGRQVAWISSFAVLAEVS